MIFTQIKTFIAPSLLHDLVILCESGALWLFALLHGSIHQYCASLVHFDYLKWFLKSNMICFSFYILYISLLSHFFFYSYFLNISWKYSYIMQQLKKTQMLKAPYILCFQKYVFVWCSLKYSSFIYWAENLVLIDLLLLLDIFKPAYDWSRVIGMDKVNFKLHHKLPGGPG